LQEGARAGPAFDLDQGPVTTQEWRRAIAVNNDGQPNCKETMMKKLLIAATLAAAVAATPLLAQQAGDKPAGTAATETCPMAGEHGTRAERRAEMQKRMQEMHARMGSHEGRGPGRGMQGERPH
jgi:formylglycine-generating enzyme required for sulfatase activity